MVIVLMILSVKKLEQTGGSMSEMKMWDDMDNWEC